MNLFTAFKEHKEFKKYRPWSYWESGAVPRDFVTPPHYAETIEILFYYGMKGDAHIGGRHFTLDGNRVFFVAPNVVHTMSYQGGDGYIKTLKIHPLQLKPLLNLEALLEYHQKTYMDMPITLPMDERIANMPQIFAESDNVNEVLIAILRFFEFLFSHASESAHFEHKVLGRDDTLREILTWTEKNFAQKITLDQVSDAFGYTKYYFCQKFKKATGITYLTYLNTLRISHACRLLKEGQSISAACDSCGFEDISYFIQLFKKMTGLTPKKYIKERNQS